MSDTLSYGLGPGGFVRMRLPEIRRAIFDDLTARTGRTFDETPDSITGQFVSVFAEREAALWELAEAVYLSAFPITAQGTSLDLAVSYAGVRRAQDTPSRVKVVLYGEQGTSIPAGSLIESTVLPEGATRPPRFALEAGVIIDRASLGSLTLEAPDPVTAGRIYSVFCNGASYSVTAASWWGVDEVASNLATALVPTGLTIATDGGRLGITGEDFSASWSDTLSLVEMGSPGLAAAQDTGAVTAPAGSLTSILSPVTGWERATNPYPAVPGTTRETDDELRARYALGVFRLGAGTVPSIEANLRQDVPGLTHVRVYENTADAYDGDGRPPHSIEAVVEGGDADLIGQRLFALKGAGITAHGNTQVTVLDGTGFGHSLRFSRPEPVHIWLRVSLATTTEEAVPGDLPERARTAIVAAGNALGVGQDVLLQRLAAAVFPAATGVARVTITAVIASPDAAAPPASAYQPTDIVIGPRQRAKFDPARVAIL